MPLNSCQIQELREAIESQTVPAAVARKLRASSYAEVEIVIGQQLRSGLCESVKDGFSNILYWGSSKMCYKEARIRRFRDKATSQKIAAFQALVANGNIPTVLDIRDIGFPEFSGMHFISKTMLFLDPDNFCALDGQIIRLRTGNPEKALDSLKGSSDGHIKVTAETKQIYDGWCTECRAISAAYFGGKYRVADIGLGLRALVQQGRLSSARQIYSQA